MIDGLEASCGVSTRAMNRLLGVLREGVEGGFRNRVVGQGRWSSKVWCTSAVSASLHAFVRVPFFILV